MKIFEIVLQLLLSVYSWSFPQPVYSEGLLVVYGGDQLVQANADWRGYTLDPYPCGASGISPAMLGRIVWFRVEHSDWEGPCLIVDAVARKHAYDSIYVRQEIAEVSRATAAKLGFEYGSWGYAFFGACPPNADSLFVQPMLYQPPLVWDYPPDDGNRSFYPYPEQQLPVNCR